MNDSEPGGFLPPTLPSPAPSNSSTASRTGLPHPRTNPLKAGSTKEETARRYVEGRLLQISRRYTKKFQPPEPGDTLKGYDNMKDVCKDLSEVVDVLWLSGTPNLQIPYLLNIALAVTTYITAFPPAPSPTFALLHKLDHAFSSLLHGKDAETGEALPGFADSMASGMSRTDMVRCKSLVEATRVQIVEIMSKEDIDVESQTDVDDTEDTGNEMDVDSSMLDEEDDTEDALTMEVAKVYERTITALGEILVSSSGYQVGSEV